MEKILDKNVNIKTITIHMVETQIDCLKMQPTDKASTSVYILT